MREERASLELAGVREERASLKLAGVREERASLELAGVWEGRASLELAGVSLVVFGLLQILPSIICLLLHAIKNNIMKVITEQKIYIFCKKEKLFRECVTRFLNSIFS